jgi:hypothetical protein
MLVENGKYSNQEKDRPYQGLALLPTGRNRILEGYARRLTARIPVVPSIESRFSFSSGSLYR